MTMNASPTPPPPTRLRTLTPVPNRATNMTRALCAAALIGLTGSAYASGIFDYGATAPSPGGNDIAQLTSGTATSVPGLNYYVDSGTPGQTFTTGSNPQGYSLLNLYLKEVSGSAGGSANTTAQTYTLRLYTVSGTSVTTISTYVSTNTMTFTQGDWIEWTGLTNVLAANTLYAYEISRNSTGWWMPAVATGSLYVGGQVAGYFPTSGSGTLTYSTTSGYDAAFDLNLVPHSDPLVTPTVISPANPVYAGSAVTLSATFSGTAPFTSFVWQQNGGTGFTNLPNSTTNVYVLNTTAMAAGTYQYQLIVTGAAGTTTNASAAMTLDSASGPTITANTSLTPSTIYTSGSTVLSAIFAGTLPIYYQWQYSNNSTVYDVPGATTSTYTLSNVQFTNAGYYSLIASNNVGGIPTVTASTPALLTVTPEVVLSDLGGAAPTPGAYDIDQFSTNGNTGAPESSGALDNYYDNNGTPCGQTFTTGANANGYSINAISIKYGTVNGGHAAGLAYTLRLYSISGATATLVGTYANQNTAPAIALGDWTSWSGGITNILAANSVYAYTLSAPSYEQMSCATNTGFTGGNICSIPAAGGTVTLGTNGNWDATFDVNLTLIAPPPTAPFVVAATTISPSTTVAGYPVTMAASIGGSTPLSYQWQFTDGATFTNNIVGATNSSYTIYDAQTTNTGYYQVVAVNSVGSTNSGFTLLTVSPLTDVEILNYGVSAPPASGFDIAQLSTAGNQGTPAGLNYYDNNGNPCGQTFTTGANEYGYSLSELYIDMGSINGGHGSGVTYTLRIYTVSAGNATLISTYVNNNTAPAIGTGAWTKWIGLTNFLAPNTTYAYTISANGGYLQLANASGNPYAGGQVCAIPTGGGAVNYGSDANEDATFLVPLVSGPVVPNYGPTLTADTSLNPSGVFVGGSVTMAAAFSGIPLPTYQWMFNNGSGAVAIAGATNNSYNLSSAQLTNAGVYYLVASNNPSGPSALASTPTQLIVAVAAQTNSTLATIVDASSSPPSPGTYDISQLTVAVPSVVSNLNYYVNNAAPPGQTFTTGNTPPTPSGYPLNTIYVNQELSSIQGGLSGVPESYTLGIYQMIGSNSVLLTAYSSVNTLTITSAGPTDGDWIAWIGLTNVLKANTTYAFSIHNNGSGYWKLGNDSSAIFPDSQGDLYPAGQAALLPAAGIGAVAYSSDSEVDAAFLIGLTPLAAPGVVVDTTINGVTLSPVGCLVQQPVTMSAVFSGSTPIFYQWQFVDTNGVTHLLPGATNNTYTIAAATLGNSGTYSLLASNALSGGSSVSSTPETLTVSLPPPTFIADFSYGSEYSGLGVIGSGTYWNTIINTGATNAAATGAIADDGSTALGIGFSATMTWNFENASATPLFSDYLLNQTATPTTFGFNNLPSGVYNVILYACDGGYQASRSSFTIGSVTETATTTTGASFIQNNNYVVFTNLLVTNGTISGTWVEGSAEAALNGAQLQLAYSLANPNLFIFTQPANENVLIGTPASVSVVAEGPGPLFYQWWSANNVNGSSILGATNASYALNTSAASTNSYYVVVTNLAGLSATSTVATVVVTPAQTLSWRGIDGTDITAWNLSSLNWSNDTAQVDGVAFINAFNAVFDDTAANFNVSVDSVVSPGSVVANNSLNNYLLYGASSMSGSMSLTMNGAATLTVSNYNTYTGGTIVNGGTLALALGGGTSPVIGTLTVNPGGSVSLQAVNALGYSSTALCVSNVNLVGGTMDNAVNGDQGFLTAFNLTGATMTSSGGGIYELDGPNGAVNSQASSTVSTISGPISLRSAYATFTVAQGTVSSNVDLVLSGVVSTLEGGGGDGLIKAGPGTMLMTAVNTYGGPTIVSNGTLLVNGTVPGAVTVNSGAVLGGTGIVDGQLTVNSGGTLAPGVSGSGTFSLNGNLTLNAGSTNVFRVNGSTTAHNAVAVGGDVAYAGVLAIETSGTFANGQSFTLFSGVGATAASNFASILGSPGAGLDFSFANGILSVVPAGPTGPAFISSHLSGGSLNLTWPAGQGWTLQAQTNSATVGLHTNWSNVIGASDGSYSITPDQTRPSVFYRLAYP